MFDSSGTPGPGAAATGGAAVSVLDVDAADDAYYERLAAWAELPDADEVFDGDAVFAAEGDGEGSVPAAREPWHDVGFDAWIEQLAAADPLRPRDPTAVVTDAEAHPVGTGIIDELARVDPAALDESGRVGVAVAWARIENYAAARKLVAIAEVAGPQPDPDDTLAAGAFAWAEIGAALRLGDGESTALVLAARHLRTHLPATLAAMLAGELTWRKVRSLVERTLTLTPEQCRQVEDRVLGKAAGRTGAQHDAAVRRAVDRIDPPAADERRRQAKRDIALARAHVGDGMGEIFARMTSEDVEIVWTGADAWARRTKATGDPRPLDHLRVAALVHWAESFLTHGNPATCDTTCTPTGTTGTAAAAGNPPRRHGRPITINLTWDLTSFLGLTNHPGELLGPGVLIPPAAIRDLVGDAELRRILFHPLTGHLLDLTPNAVRPSAPLAGYIAIRDVTPTTPTAGPTTTATAASAGDIDHATPRAHGGTTTRDNLHTPTRRWHRAKTHAGWTVHPNNQGGWTWTSPTGRTYRTEPHDYRLGP